MRKHDHLAAGAHFGQARGNSITVQVIKRGNRVDENDGMRFRALRSFNCSVLLFLRPILWDQCGGFSPWYFDECVLKPLITKIRMLSDDQLEAWNIVLGELQQQLEQPAHSIEVGVGFRLLHRTIGIPVYLLGGEVDLGWLVDQQEARNRTVVLSRE